MTPTSSRRSPPTTWSPARRWRSTCRRPAWAARIVSGLIDVVVTMILFVAAIFVFVVAALQADGALIWASFIATMIVVFLVYPATLETLTRGQVARQAGLRPARGPRRRRADHLPALLRPGADRFRRDLRLHRGAGLLLGADELARQAARRLRRRDVRRPRPGPAPAGPADPDAAAAGGVGPSGRHDEPADRAGAGGAPVPGPAARPSTRSSRATIGTRLADQVSEYVAPAPPPGTPPEAYLAAVIASRRERDQARLRREAELRRRLTARR